MVKQQLSTQAAARRALAVIALSLALGGCRDQAPPPAPPSAPVTAPAASAERTKQQAMDALMSLPELKAWSAQLEKSSGGKVHGALIEYDQAPRIIDGKRYWQFSFVENAADAAHTWESFLVAQQGDEILVEDAATDETLTLEQWREQEKPLARTSALK